MMTMDTKSAVPGATSKVTDERLHTNFLSTFATGVKARDRSQVNSPCKIAVLEQKTPAQAYRLAYP